MPNAKIHTYGQYDINGVTINVNKITCEDDRVANISKEVSFGKYSKKLPLRNRTTSANIDTELSR